MTESYILCLDIGNSHLFGGLLTQEQLQFSFRYPSKSVSTSDQIGVFLKQVLIEHQWPVDQVQHIAICSVVPHLNYSVQSACIKYFGITPFLLQPGAKTGLKIDSNTSHHVGADRIANSIAAMSLFPGQPVIVIDFGTATTFCTIDAQNTYRSGPILPGVRTSMEALSTQAALLSSVDIIQSASALGKSTEANMQAGLYYSHLGAVQHIIQRICEELSPKQRPCVIATGGFASLFESEQLFDHIIPDLVLQGLSLALKKNISCL